ncbi:MAG: FeoA family protein [Chloroflexota bacterium]|nr:FeoA family protein [Chloroflexota bacterium]
MPLSMVAPGQKVKFVAVHGGWGIRRRLADMGFNPGVRIKVIQGGFSRGPIIVSVRDVRLALGRGMAQKIMVKLLER